MTRIAPKIANLRRRADACEREYRFDDAPTPQWVADVRQVCRLAELAEAWDTAPLAAKSERLVELRAHIKEMRREP